MSVSKGGGQQSRVFKKEGIAMNVSVETTVSEMGITLCVIRLSGLSVSKTSPAVEAKKKEIALMIKGKWRPEMVAIEPHVQGYCALYEKVGANKEKLVPSCHALVKMVLKKGYFPTINTVVDVYNCVSASHLVDIGAHDAARIEGDLRIGITTGNERFVPLGMDEERRVKPGEYAYMDDTDILCRMDVRQADKTKLNEATKDALIVANSNLQMTDDALLKACQNVCELAEGLLGAKAEIIDFI